MADAKKLMSRKDRKEFQWTLEEYEQHAKADLLSGVTSANVMNASANWHLTYLDGMKLQLEHHVDKLYKNIDSKTRNHFKESLNENYLNTAFELQKGIGIGEKMEIPYDERKLENILRTPWASDGKNFSQRIWKDRTQLVNNLQRNLSESVIRGDSDTDMIQALSKDEDRAEFNTRRLVETESAYFDSLSEQECCEDFGVEKYRFLAVLDMKTSDICQELDNKVFLEKDRQVGVNAPPMHPFCRSTTAPVIDEDFLTSRRAKNPKTGEYDEIPADMNYKQWKEKYVEGKEPVEEVKQEQVKTNTPNGYEFETKPLEQKASEGETVHKETAVPPKKKEEKGFDSEAYENRIKKQVEKQGQQIKSRNIQNYNNTEKQTIEKRIRKSKRFNLAEIESDISNKNTEVEWDYINSDDFKKAFDNLTENKELNETLYNSAIEILEHRDGTVYEDLYMIGLNNEFILKNTTENKPYRASFNQEQEEQSLKNRDNFITLHNHPNGAPPSHIDFNHSFNKLYPFGISLGHNGAIYKFNRIKRPISDEKIKDIDKKIEENRKKGQSQDLAYTNAYFEYMLDMGNSYYYGIHYEFINKESLEKYEKKKKKKK